MGGYQQRELTRQGLGYLLVAFGLIYGCAAVGLLWKLLLTFDPGLALSAAVETAVSACCLGWGAVYLGRHHPRWVKLWLGGWIATGVLFVGCGAIGLARPAGFAAVFPGLHMPDRIAGPFSLLFGMFVTVEAIWSCTAWSPPTSVRYVLIGGMVAVLITGLFFKYSPFWLLGLSAALIAYVLNEELHWIERLRRW